MDDRYVKSIAEYGAVLWPYVVGNFKYVWNWLFASVGVAKETPERHDSRLSNKEAF